VRTPCCSAGGRGPDGGCQEEGGQQAAGLPVGWPRLCGSAGRQPGVREPGSGVRWQQPGPCSNAARGGGCFALRELPARGAAPRWAPGAGRTAQGPSCCSLSCPSHWVRTAWKPPRIKALPQSLPRSARSILQWEPRQGWRDVAWFQVTCRRKRNRREQQGVISDLMLDSVTHAEGESLPGLDLVCRGAGR